MVDRNQNREQLPCRLVTDPIIAQIQLLRYRVWKSEGVSLYDETSGVIADPHDDHAMHWGAFDGDRLVGAARLCIHDKKCDALDGHLFSGIDLPTPIANMNRLVVLREYRRAGIGRTLDEARIEAARRLGARAIMVAPVDRDARVQHLRKLGFVTLAGEPVTTRWSSMVRVHACYRLLADLEVEGW